MTCPSIAKYSAINFFVQSSLSSQFYISSYLRNPSNWMLLRRLQSSSSVTFSVNFLCFFGHFWCGLICCLFYKISHSPYCCGTACCPVRLLCLFPSSCFLLSNCKFFTPICLPYCWKHLRENPCAFSRFFFFGLKYKFPFLEGFSKYFFELQIKHLSTIESNV